MISFEIFMAGLLITSVLTGLATEAVKKIFAEHSINYRANTLAGIVALILSTAVCVSYAIVIGSFTAHMAVCFVAQVFMSWLCAMVGYDKVIQAISQFKTQRKD